MAHNCPRISWRRSWGIKQMYYTSHHWQPTRILRVGEAEETSTGVTRVLTDAGWAFCKPIGNRQGEQVLACEWVCIRLARWLGLQTFRAAIIDLAEEATFDLPEHKGQKYHARAGPCFLTESTPGRQWNRDRSDLDLLVNPQDITLLVALDTWVRNRDRRHPDRGVRKPNYGNVFLAEVEDSPDRFRLVAMDHTHCFDNGNLHAKLANIDNVRDPLVYGLFPQFIPYMNPLIAAAAAAKLKTLEKADVVSIIQEVPAQWEVDQRARDVWAELIFQRARHLAGTLAESLEHEIAAMTAKPSTQASPPD